MLGLSKILVMGFDCGVVFSTLFICGWNCWEMIHPIFGRTNDQSMQSHSPSGMVGFLEIAFDFVAQADGFDVCWNCQIYIH